HSLKADNFVFPAIGANGVIHPGEHITQDMVQKMIDKAIDGASISHSTGCFTTHTF
ncbi:hypothetical protein SERLA73DRAFT_66490, partial [Serpula lacrymans var. lacrymans S7.3]